ncbi:TIGR00270 family protein [Halovenus sp. WSH3]|uniref:TIGR00270 family protein n=1 Tax=Halovenus carboxidivorans TaxID=2692199 RepID=A0A6B0TB71_9EURY|nr:multiprotein bridging factor aMBF1 [Halovenus carboxidivorans]MXR52873.1 TIGR00270 family protein [Halovenus carboxidivorans]
MVQCEMCGTETSNPNRVKIEGAELDVCDECTDFGTEIDTGSSSSSSTKYSTSSSSDSSSSSGAGATNTGASTASSGGGGGGRRQDMFDDIEELAQDYDERIRQAREKAGMSQEDLAQDLNEKASLIRKLEQGEMLPTDETQEKLERSLGVDLSAGGSTDDTDWESDSSTGEYTLGDVVERKDS